MRQDQVSDSGKEVIQMDDVLAALREQLEADVECPHCTEVSCTFLRCRDLD